MTLYDLTKDLSVAIMETKEKDIVKQAIDIYNRSFETYDDYIAYIRILTDSIRNINQKNAMKQVYNLYVEPVILSEQTFNYILELRDENNKKVEREGNK